MRQSTLLFVGRSSGSGAEVEKDDINDNVSPKEELAPPAPKRTRRVAAQKSQEQTKRQSQLSLGENGPLNRQTDRDDDKAVVISDSDTDDERVVRPSKRIVFNGAKAAAKVVSKPKEPISLMVKGTQRDFNEGAHSFFEKRQPVKDGGKSSIVTVAGLTAPIRHKWNQGREAPWPDSSNVHIRPEESSITSAGPLKSLLKREKSAGHKVLKEQNMFPWQSSSYASTSKFQMVPEDRSSGNSLLDLSSTSRPAHIPPKEAVSPAAKRVINSLNIATSQSHGIMWVDQWRPVKAEEVLGNESRAIQLRDWLNELRVIGDNNNDQNRRKIVRRKKKIRKTAGDSFIVDDDEEEEEAWYEHFRRAATSQQACDSIDEDEDMLENEESLSNAMLLTGPTGSGKTASVYACAAELGFEVFEIYPGQGRRSGKDVAQAVGDLGRNHMVSSGGIGGGSTWKGFKIAKSDNKNGVVESNVKTKAAPRQSLILLEEVDLLFEEDKGFWAAIIELIATSKRPIIMTCNHTYSIPFESLILQDTLRFEAPSVPLAVNYMSTLAQAHGSLMEEDQIEILYKSTRGSQRVANSLLKMSFPSSGVLDPNSHLASIDKSCKGITSYDLRQAITQLQYLCQSVSTKAVKENGFSSINGAGHTSKIQGQKLRSKTIRTMDLKSYCDCYLTRPFDRESELLEPDEYESVSKSDDVQGSLLIPLPKSKVKLEDSTLAEFGREEEYQFALLDDEEEEEALSSEEIEILTRKRIHHSTILRNMMRAVSSTMHNQSPSDDIAIDYAPIIDNMIKVDDLEQQAWESHIMQAVQEVNSSRNSPNEDDTDNLKAARSSLLQLGIRPSRHTTRLLLEKGSDGLLSLARKDAAPCRWITAEEEVLEKIRCSRLVPFS